MIVRALVFVSLAGCGPQPVALTSGVYQFEGLRGRADMASAVVKGTTIELDVVTREVKVTITSATRRFSLSMDAARTPGCSSAAAQDTRTLDAPNVQLGELLIDAPLIRADCPTGSGVIVLQQGPLGSDGAAPACSAEVLCLTYRRLTR